MLLGVVGSGSVHVSPSVANKSSQSAFFVQDDWRISSKLTLNLGLRYEWAVPYAERYNRNQFTCQSCDSGIFVPSLGDFVGREILGRPRSRLRTGATPTWTGTTWPRASASPTRPTRRPSFAGVRASTTA